MKVEKMARISNGTVVRFYDLLTGHDIEATVMDCLQNVYTYSTYFASDMKGHMYTVHQYRDGRMEGGLYE